MKLILSIEEFKTVIAQNLVRCCVRGLKMRRLAASKYILSIVLFGINRSTTTGGHYYILLLCRAEDIAAHVS